MLDHRLRVMITRDAVPVENVAVRWSTTEGSLSPATTTTDAGGVATAAWTLKHLFAQQVAFAAIDSQSRPGG